MPLEATTLIIDNSEYAGMWNGDYLPTRFEVQADASSIGFQTKIDSNGESTVGIMTINRKRVCEVSSSSLIDIYAITVLVTRCHTKDLGHPRCSSWYCSWQDRRIYRLPDHCCCCTTCFQEQELSSTHHRICCSASRQVADYIRRALGIHIQNRLVTQFASVHEMWLPSGTGGLIDKLETDANDRYRNQIVQGNKIYY